jgi:glycosyltransferase involved in cell wall biosynthesis
MVPGESLLTTRMHVLTLTPFYPNAADSTNGCFVSETIPELEKEGVRCPVIAVRSIHQTRTLPHLQSPARWVRYFSLPGNAGLSSAGRFLYFALRHHVARLHADDRLDLLHAHAALPCGEAAKLLARDLGIPFVVTVHGLDAFYTTQVLGWSGRRCARRAQEVYRAASRVICISRRVAERIHDGSRSTAKTSVVYNGVDPGLFTPRASTPAERPTILSVGNLIPLKAHALLLHAVASACVSVPDVFSRIIGDGPERTRLVALAQQLGITNRVEFLGRRSRTEVAQAMREATLFVLPSRYEGLGCVYLEAMASSIAAVGCRGQGIEEVIRHRENGWLIEPGNLDDLIAAIRTLLADPHERDQIGSAARRTILDRFTLEHQAQKLTAIYRECVA